MLSFAERLPSVEVAACWGVVPLTGTAEGIVAGGGGKRGQGGSMVNLRRVAYMREEGQYTEVGVADSSAVRCGAAFG